MNVYYRNNTVDVFYVDYGNTELTAVDKICTYVPDQFKECPPQAIKCRLAGITPVSFFQEIKFLCVWVYGSQPIANAWVIPLFLRYLKVLSILVHTSFFSGKFNAQLCYKVFGWHYTTCFMAHAVWSLQYRLSYIFQFLSVGQQLDFSWYKDISEDDKWLYYECVNIVCWAWLSRCFLVSKVQILAGFLY